jgi:hypothetical protein
MTPREKAEELIRKYYRWGLHKDGQSLSWLESKECALIAVDEILEEALGLDDNDYQSKYDYWQEVKQKIEKL